MGMPRRIQSIFLALAFTAGFQPRYDALLKMGINSLVEKSGATTQVQKESKRSICFCLHCVHCARISFPNPFVQRSTVVVAPYQMTRWLVSTRSDAKERQEKKQARETARENHFIRRNCSNQECSEIEHISQVPL
jgi:hypothetical protein